MAKPIFKQTSDYIQALLEADEVKAYIKAFEAYSKDLEAKTLLADFQEARQTLAIFQQGGFDGVEEQREKVRRLQNAISQHKGIQALLKTQETMQTFVGELAGVISQKINFPFAPPQRGGCCG